MSEHVTIAEAARRLGISRPRLSTYIKQAGLQKTVGRGGAACVSYEQVSSLVQRLGAEGKLRVSTRTKRPNERPIESTSTQASSELLTLVQTMNAMMLRVSEENTKLHEQLVSERKQAALQFETLIEQIEAMRAEIGNLKLLPEARAGAYVSIDNVRSSDDLAALVDTVRERNGEQIKRTKRAGAFSRLFGASRREPET
jgi:predicted site-specific integrase-resolvase